MDWVLAKVMVRHDRLSRRRLVGALGGSVATGFLAGCLDDDGDDLERTDDGDDGDGDDEQTGESEENVEIGTVSLAVLEPFTGALSDFAEEHYRGTELAIQQVNESDEYDFEFEYSEYNTQTSAVDAIHEAEEAIQDYDADFLTGCISSSSALAVSDIADSNGVVYTPGAADISITGENCSEYVFRAETNTVQTTEVMAQWVHDELGDQIFYHIADYVYGQSVRDEFEDRMESFSDSYENIGETVSDPGSTDFNAFITQIQNNADDADALVVGMTGSDLVVFLTQARDRGLHDEIPIVTTTGSFRAIREGAGAGASDIYSATRYVPGLDTGTNGELVSAYQDEYGGDLPDNFSRVGYQSVRMLANGIREAGSGDPAEVKEILPGMEHDTVFGSVEFRECDGQATNPVWMAECVEPTEGEVADVELLTEISGDQSLPACAESPCNRT